MNGGFQPNKNWLHGYVTPILFFVSNVNLVESSMPQNVKNDEPEIKTNQPITGAHRKALATRS